MMRAASPSTPGNLEGGAGWRRRRHPGRHGHRHQNAEAYAGQIPVTYNFNLGFQKKLPLNFIWDIVRFEF
jgi:hypothetical protein